MLLVFQLPALPRKIYKFYQLLFQKENHNPLYRKVDNTIVHID